MQKCRLLSETNVYHKHFSEKKKSCNVLIIIFRHLPCFCGRYFGRRHSLTFRRKSWRRGLKISLVRRNGPQKEYKLSGSSCRLEFLWGNAASFKQTTVMKKEKARQKTMSSDLMLSRRIVVVRQPPQIPRASNDTLTHSIPPFFPESLPQIILDWGVAATESYRGNECWGMLWEGPRDHLLHFSPREKRLMGALSSRIAHYLIDTKGLFFFPRRKGVTLNKVSFYRLP